MFIIIYFYFISRAECYYHYGSTNLQAYQALNTDHKLFNFVLTNENLSHMREKKLIVQNRKEGNCTKM